MDSGEVLSRELEGLGVPVPAAAQDKLHHYVRELEHWNRTINLTGLHGPELVHRLVVEPVWIGWKLEMSGTLADIGSGNGCPAIPLCVTRPFREAHLVESRVRRAAFLRHLLIRLDLEGITVHNARLEDLAGSWDVDWITLQGVRPSEAIIKGIRGIAPRKARVAWITSVGVPPVAGCERLCVPGSLTQIWVFHLDQF